MPSLAYGAGKTLLVWEDNRTGDFDIYGMFIDSSSIGVREILPPFENEKISLSAFPNPFLGSTTIIFYVPDPKAGKPSSAVSLKVFDPVGRLQRTLIENTRGVGIYTINWNGKDQKGKEVGGGIYFIELEVSGKKITHKLIKLK